ncbi:MAG: hypothetical protein SFZ02_17270 [bacterium]|nr:hypothetical protein [bacterium]
MTFPEILDAIEALSGDELAQVERLILQKKQKTDMPDLSAFEVLSDNALWDIVNTPFDVIKNARMRQLDDLRDTRHLTSEEEKEADDLIQAFDKYILRRSMAMVTLQKRGVDVMAELSRQ